MIEKGELVEWNEVHGNFYGTPKHYVDEMLSQGHDVLFDLDVYGKINFDKVYPQAIGILILPPSLEELERRLQGRATDAPEVIALRLHNATKEIEFAEQHGKYQYTIYNEDIKKAAGELRAILL
jgi:guanylate kinase